MEQNNQEKKVKKSKSGFKKFLKISGFTLLGIVGIIGVAMGIALISGAYSKEKINILSLSTSTENLLATNSPTVYIGDNSAEVVVMAGETLSVTLSYTPDNANQKTLSVKYNHGKKLLSNAPTSVTAGEKFDLKFNNNVEENNNLGGEVEIKFTDSTTLVSFTLKVLVDNVVDDDDIVLSASADSGFREVEVDTSSSDEDAEDDETITFVDIANEKRFVAKRDNTTKYITLQGKTVNSVAPKRGYVTFNDSTINSFKYKTPYTFIDGDNNKLVHDKTADKQEVNRDYTVDYKYALQTISSTSKAKISTYFPKTFAMQYDFKEEWLNKAVNNDLDNYDYTGLNAYINKYFYYIYPELSDFTPAEIQVVLSSYSFYGLTVNEQTGLYEVVTGDGEEQDRLIGIMQSIFVYAEQDIVVYDIEVGKIDVQESISYTLFQEISYDNIADNGIPDIVDGMNIRLISKSGSDVDNSLLNADIGKLVIAPYIKIDDDVEDNSKTITHNGIEYLKYVKIDDTWYEFDQSKLKVGFSSSVNINYKTTSQWDFEALNPTLTGDKDKYVIIYSMESINENGDSSWVYAKSNITVNYDTPSNFGFENNNTKMIYHLHNNINGSSATLADLKNTTGCTINSLTLSVSDVIDSNVLEDLQYKVVHFFMVKATNTYNYNSEDYDVFEVDPSWNVCKLQTIDGKDIKVGNETVFYDLGTNPTLNIKNITSLDDDDLANKVKIFVCIMQSDKSGSLVEIENIDGETQTIKYAVAYCVQSGADMEVETNNITIDHFASKLFAYVEVGDDIVSGSASNIKPNNNQLQIYITAYEFKQKEGNAEETEEGNAEENKTISYTQEIWEREEGICFAYLNQRALQNYYDFSNGLLKNSVEFATGMPNSIKETNIGEIVNSVTGSNIAIDETKGCIVITLSFNDISKDDYKVGENYYATSDNPLLLDFKVYLIPEGDLGTSMPYYDLGTTSFDAYCATNIEISEPDTASGENSSSEDLT